MNICWNRIRLALVALLSLVMVRPDQDDVFVVNRSTWIAEHDTSFPERDTVFSDDVLPVQGAQDLESYERWIERLLERRGG